MILAGGVNLLPPQVQPPELSGTVYSADLIFRTSSEGYVGREVGDGIGATESNWANGGKGFGAF